MENNEWFKILGSGTVITALAGLIAKTMGWIRFEKRDAAEVSKMNSSSQVDLADVANKKIDDEVKISKAALEWTVQLAEQLAKSNVINEKRQVEIDRLHDVMKHMREDFETRMNEMEIMLQGAQKELTEERNKNKLLLDRLNAHINGNK